MWGFGLKGSGDFALGFTGLGLRVAGFRVLGCTGYGFGWRGICSTF